MRSMLVVEVRTPSGHSSSYPPHKHDTDDLLMGVYSAILGFFIPSGGGKWIIEAPYVPRTALTTERTNETFDRTRNPRCTHRLRR